MLPALISSPIGPSICRFCLLPNTPKDVERYVSSSHRSSAPVEGSPAHGSGRRSSYQPTGAGPSDRSDYLGEVCDHTCESHGLSQDCATRPGMLQPTIPPYSVDLVVNLGALRKFWFLDGDTMGLRCKIRGDLRNSSVYSTAPHRSIHSTVGFSDRSLDRTA